MTIVFKQKLRDEFIAVELIDVVQGRIKLPDWQKYLRGTVIAVGPGKMLPFGERAPMATKVGDTVQFGPAAGMEAEYGVGQKLRIMRDSDVDAVWS